MSPLQLRDGDLVMIKGKIYRIQDHFLHLHTKDEDITLKDLYHDIGSVLDGDLPMNVALLRKWRGVISKNVPDWNVPTENQCDNHEDRIKALETGNTQALIGRIAGLEEENTNRIASNIVLTERMKVSSKRISDLEKEVSNLKNVLAEAGFNTNGINEND